jgi:hypothetical protein
VSELDTLTTDDLAEPPGEFTIIPPGARRPCAEEGCGDFVPAGSAPARKYCDAHFRGAGGKKPKPPKEQPPKLVVDLGGAKKSAKKDERAAATAAGAAAFMTVIATGVQMSGDDVCSSALAAGAAQWGASVGELSKYQPWLADFFAPAGGQGQLGAWLGFTMATGAVLLPIMAHHGILPESIGARVAGTMVAASNVGNDPPAAA